MANKYDYDHATQEDDEDEDIGALGSILSWDEDEEGGVSGGNSGGESSALPDLVSFNLKDGGVNNALHQLQAMADGTNLPLPTPIDFSQPNVASASNPAAVPQHRPEESRATASIQKPPPAAQSQVSHHTVQQQLQHLQQQYQQQAQQQVQQQAQQQSIQTQAPPAQATHGGTASAAQQQAQAVQQSVQQGAFQLFQQNALLAQQPTSSKQSGGLLPAVLMPGLTQGQDQAQQQAQAQQFAFAAQDPNALLRQLQVAHLRQQFNVVQQGRSLAPQAAVPQNQAGQGAPQSHQHVQYQAPCPPVPPAVTLKASSKPQPKKSAPAAPVPITTKSSSVATLKVPLVSASDTDGESRHASSRTAVKKSSDKAMLAARNEIDTTNMTPEDKMKANRDRNREHARNTRLRKKAYLETLKSTVDELCRERDTLVSERAGAANILVEMHNTRTEVLMSFFALRSANEKRREIWSSILDESCFACVMPVTPYRSFPASEVQVSKCQRTILGIDGMMSDTSSLHVLLNSLVDRSRFPNATIMFRYTLVTEEAVVAGNQMMARWVMSTLNATQCGARMEVAKQGMLCCKFNSAHKIIGLELMFDVMAFMLQLKQAAGSDTFSVIPNTVQTCQRNFEKPMMMTLAEEPYTIVQVNKLWEEMTGYTAEEVVGKASFRVLEGEKTEAAAVEGLFNEIRFKRPSSAMMLRYKKNGDTFRDFFLTYPLSTDSRITHYLTLSSYVDSGLSVQQIAAERKATASHIAQSDGGQGQASAFFGVGSTTAAAAQQTKSTITAAFNSQASANFQRPESVRQVPMNVSSGSKRPPTDQGIGGAAPPKQNKTSKSFPVEID